MVWEADSLTCVATENSSNLARSTSGTARLEERVHELLSDINRFHENGQLVTSSSELEQFERTVVGLCDELAGMLVAYGIQKSVESKGLAEETKLLVDSHPKKLRNHGVRKVEIRPARGKPIPLFISYYCVKGRTLCSTKRDKGLYPSLMILGIYDHCTPCLLSDVALAATALGSLEEARKLLESRGVHMNIKTIRSITYRYGERVRQTLRSDRFGFAEDWSKQRVVISLDGGRVRIRKNKRGPRTKKGGKRYQTDWKEPKLFHIYVLDEDGNKSKDVLPVIDGTLEGTDAVMMLLMHYIIKLKIPNADLIMVVADGAPWIWKRMKSLLQQLDIPSDKIMELLDFFHAVEHLECLANLKKSWSDEERKKWVKQQKALLKNGRMDSFIEKIEAICLGRNGKKIRKQRDYFLRNRERLDYSAAKRNNLPRGSGPMESAIRRVINLRLKGAGIFWHQENAEAMIVLRSYYKSGRWSQLESMASMTSLCA